MERSETWLAGIMQTPRGVGNSPSAFANVLRKLRVKFTALEDATFQDIERLVSNGLPVLVAWTLHGECHYSVVTGVSGAELFMVEPFDGKIIKVNKSRFLRLWHDPCNQTTRWMMVVGEDQRMEASLGVTRFEEPHHFRASKVTPLSRGEVCAVNNVDRIGRRAHLSVIAEGLSRQLRSGS